jgi:hypothetical protein
MLDLDEEALICDLAETYGIFDYESLPVQTVATLSIGLRGDSRIKLAAAGRKLGTTDALLATIADYLAMIFWTKTKDGQNGRNRPKSIREALENGNKKDNEIVGFESVEEFERAREALLEEVTHG